MTTETPKTAKKAAPRRRALAGAEAGSGPETRTVITSTGTATLPVSDEPINAPGALTEVTGNERVPDANIIVTPGPIAEDTTKGFLGLDTNDLKEIALFFQKDVVIADAERGASKNELLAALASDADGSDAVTWSDYQDIFLAANTRSVPVEFKQAGVADAAERETLAAINVAIAEEEPVVLVKMTRKNPRYDIAGYTFTSVHPYQSVPEKTAEYILGFPGFSIALPSEVTNYYK